MKISLFDLHCDTLSELYDKKLGLTSNSLHISLDKTECYENYAQIAAVWSNPDFTPDECYRRLFEIIDYFKNQLQNTGNYHAGIASDGGNTAVSFTKGRKTFIYSVEGGMLLNGDLTRLDELFGKGIRILTLVWNKNCCIGGAFDTNEGLTPFGEEVAKKCFEIGIIPDISHSSDRSAFQLAKIAEKYGKPFIASHSNSRSVFAHPRNLTDELFNKIMKSGGVAGISLAPQHLSSKPADNVGFEDIYSHIEHYLSLGGENTVCFGCDFDGISACPAGISDISDLYSFAEYLQKKNYSDSLINRIFYKNAFDFICKNI